MVEAVCNFWCQRARFVRFFGTFSENVRSDKSRGRGRKTNFSARLDFRFNIYAACFTNQRFVNVRRFLYFILAFPDVAFVSEANLYKSLNK